MGERWGLGPVFAFEWLTRSRSPRVYATRVGFVFALLLVLIVVSHESQSRGSTQTISEFAEAGSAFYVGLAGMQLTLVLLAAPAATAGAICLDKSRGSLTHLLVTDLSDPEIILGKLAARVVPTLMLVFCALPVQFLASLLGGIDPDALIGSTLITIGVTIFSCALALTFSVWGKKTQDVLIATYGVLIVWLLTYATASGFGMGAKWLWKVDPFQLAFAPYTEPGSVGLLDFVTFLVVMLGLSAVAVGLAVWRLRPVAAQGDRPRLDRVRRDWAWLRRFHPQLDTNPVLWREWHRARPSRWSGRIWVGYYVMVAIFSAISIDRILRSSSNDQLALFTVAFSSSIGLLLLSVESATSLAEERARGSLDVLMTTPLTTRSIALAKWRGTYRRVFSLAVMPALVAGFIKNDVVMRFVLAGMTLGLILIYGSAITCLGLALATWIPRLGRAVSLCVGIYAVVTIGGFFLAFMGIAPNDLDAELAVVSPFYGPVFPLEGFSPDQNPYSVLVVPFWIAFYGAVSVALLAATLMTFDRCLGRANDSPRRTWPQMGRRAGKHEVRPPFMTLDDPAILATRLES